MKWSIFLLFVLITFMGCEETALQIEEPVVKKITISASVKGVGGAIDPVGITSITAGDKMTYKIYPTKGYNLYSVFVDGVDKTSEVIDENTFNLKNAFSEKNLIFTFMNTKVILLTKDPWFVKELGNYIDDSLQSFTILDPKRLTDQYIYNINQTYIFKTQNGEEFGNGKWSIDPVDGSPVLGDGNEIVEITEKSFVFRKLVWNYPDGKKGYSVQKYWRP